MSCEVQRDDDSCPWNKVDNGRQGLKFTRPNVEAAVQLHYKKRDERRDGPNLQRQVDPGDDPRYWQVNRSGGTGTRETGGEGFLVDQGSPLILGLFTEDKSDGGRALCV